MSDMTSKRGNFSTETMCPFRKLILSTPPVSLEERARRERGAERLKEAFSSIPFYARRAEKDPDYWNKLYASAINTYWKRP